MDIIENCISSLNLTKKGLNNAELKGAYLNTRSINPEGTLNDIKKSIDDCGEVDIICLVETWLKQEDLKFNKILEYKDFHHVRSSRGGGISVYIKNIIKCLQFETYGEFVQIIKMKLKVMKP